MPHATAEAVSDDLPGGATRVHGAPEIVRVGPEIELARLLLDRRLCTKEELRDAQGRRRERFPDEPVALAGLLEQLVEDQLLTPLQAERLQGEVNAGSSVEHLPGYQLLERLGGGGMGVVHRAKQSSMDREVAVKFLRPKLSQDPSYIERFLREAKLAAQLSHNHIVQAIDAGEAYGHHYFVMEYVAGTTLAKRLRRAGKIPEREAVRVARQVAEALDHAHRKGMVHRDVKPENIMLTPEGVAKLADLGLARRTDDKAAREAEAGLLVGTPYTVAPEQVRGLLDIDSRADMYSLGVTLYHMVTGRRPFEGTTAREVCLKHLEERPPPVTHLVPELSDDLALVVEMMMARERRDRYPTPADLLADLTALENGRPPRLALEGDPVYGLLDLAKGEGTSVRDSGEGPPPFLPPTAPTPPTPAAGTGRRGRRDALPDTSRRVRVLALLLTLSLLTNLALLAIRP